MTDLSRAESFFYDQAGYSWDPSTQAEREGHQATARDLAAAEHWAEQEGYRFEWSDDAYGDHSYTDQPEFSDYQVSTCELCVMVDVRGDCVASLGCVDDASREYRRVVEAELALEVAS